jgi:hypothetical protein
MGLVRGEDVILSALITQEGTVVPVPFGCARSVTFDISTDFIETSGIDSGNFKTFLPSGKQFSGNIEGLVFLDRPATVENTKATAVLDFTDLIDAGLFPTSNGIANALTDYPTFEAYTLGIVPGAVQANLAVFLADLNGNIAVYAFNPGYTSVISGNTLIISAPAALGASINGFTAHCNYNINGNTGTITGTFSGGTDGYNPTKISLGWMYDKIVSGEKIFLKYYETDDDNHFLQKLCEVYIESINETASFDNMVTYTASFKGNGGPTITYGEI